MRYLIGRYHEIILKGRNRWRFVEQLKRNLRSVFADYRLGKIRAEGPRLIVALPEALSDAIAAERAALLFGLQNFSISHSVKLDTEDLSRHAITLARNNSDARSFRIATRRADKRFPLTSMEIDRAVGAAVGAATGLKVNLDQPDLTILIEILPDAAYISDVKHPGAGGLPVGITGHGMVLLSGGIDSPVAAYRMMRRGMHTDFVHFHSYPLVSAASREKALELAAQLTSYESRSRLILVGFAPIQREIVARAPSPLRVVLYRRFMLRIAAKLARQCGAQALITGESLGQVASQTLENLAVIEHAADIPVMRPLLGMDKNEIVAQARRIGTFETSILPDQDCCSLFVPAHPETHARLQRVCEAEERFEIERIVADAVSGAQIVENAFPPRTAAAQ